MWWRWENNRNVAVVVYSFTLYEEVLKKKLSVGSIRDRCRVDVGSMYDKVDVGSMWGRCRVDVWSMWSWMENTYNKMRRRRENNKIVEEGIKN